MYPYDHCVKGYKSDRSIGRIKWVFLEIPCGASHSRVFLEWCKVSRGKES
ncbi:hypothetical protein LR48_Vigan06g074400 [Vigna angularis]|uniref:Uncharacterized protein n=1 Tax=Phaseolus angularis TaxID=3914 RepID=A0A0L9US73_PHAAN|nr:hypothetical protein LR48_Vigan06g074300 [Vigna angularis]KOM45438.1 hypothetical protein LR48_Vigan06g074400 [Vigna angularis]